MKGPVRHVVLLGLMGVGKTTVGRALAEALGWPLTDSDAAILKDRGATVRELNDLHGVDDMHHLEAEHLLNALSDPAPSVIAAAASVADDPACRHAIKQDDVYGVWLQGRAETLAERFGGGAHRPVLDQDTEGLFRRQLGERSRHFSEMARASVSVEGRSPREIADEILAGLGATAG